MNHPNADVATDGLIKAFDYYVCTGNGCDIVCDLMTIDLRAAQRRLCMDCLSRLMRH